MHSCGLVGPAGRLADLTAFTFFSRTLKGNKLLDPREQVAIASRVLASTGLTDFIWGHVSVRDPDGRGVWLKAANWGLEEIVPDRVHLVDDQGRVLYGSGECHKEYPIHTEVTAARADVGAVVHVHSPYSVALAAAGHELRPVSHAANYFGPAGVARFSLTSDLILTSDLGRAVADCLGESSAAFLVNHGVVTVGETVQTATIAAILLELACQQQLLTVAYGGWPTWTDPQESEHKRQHIYSDQSLRGLWDYLVRRLDTGKSQPPAELAELAELAAFAQSPHALGSA